MSADRDPLPAARRTPARLARRRGVEVLVPWVIAAIVTSALYLGQSVLIPIFLAALLSFLLSPIVASLRKARLPRAIAVAVALILSLGAFSATAGIIISQASTLSKDAPVYAERISAKASGLRADVQRRFGFLLHERGQASDRRRSAAQTPLGGARPLGTTQARGVLPVEVQPAPPTAIDQVKAYALPALAPLETIIVVLIVTIFILFQKEDLRDRLIRLMGAADLHRTTVALDDSAKRLSRYFLAQFTVNCGFGAIIWVGLFLLGVPSPGLWGILAGLLRFVPYVGIVVAALPPLALAAAVDPGWSTAIWVALLFALVEPIVGYVVEPLLYGRSTGLSPLSVVVAALFWTWIWGPLGLVLSMPLTLVLVVLGRHIPAFEIFDVLLGDRPALSPAETFYQRAFAGHPDEAIEQAEELLETHTLADYYDEVMLGGLRLAASDMDRGAIRRADLKAICAATLDVLAALQDHANEDQTLGLWPIAEKRADERTGHRCSDLDGHSVLCFPGRGPLDAAVAEMMTQLLRRAGCEVRLLSRGPSSEEHGSSTPRGDADTVCVLGLFDERAFRRIQPLIEQGGASRVLIGVRRTVEAQAAGTISPDLLPTLSSLCDAVRAAAAPPARPTSTTAGADDDDRENRV